MTDRPQLTTPRLHVVLDDGREFTVQALNADLLRYDRTAAKHNWPGYTATGELRAPFLWLTFLAWSASRREGQIDDGMSWESFANDHCLQVRNVDEDANGTSPNGETSPAVVDPFQSEVADG